MPSKAFNPKTDSRPIKWFARILLLAWVAFGLLYLLAESEPMPFGRSFAWVLLLLGSFGIFVDVLGAAARFLSRWIKVPPTPEQAAGSLLNLFQAIYQPPEYRPASPSDFPGIDVEFLRRTQEALETLEFKILGDFENVILSRANPELRFLGRFLLSRDGTIMACIADAKPTGNYLRLQKAGKISADFRAVDLETEFEDGAFLCTSTAASASKLNEVPGILRQFYPKTMEPAQIVQNHIARLDTSVIAPRRHRSIDDVFASDARSHAIKAAHRKATGWVKAEEAMRFSNQPLNAAQQQMVQILEDSRPQKVYTISQTQADQGDLGGHGGN